MRLKFFLLGILAVALSACQTASTDVASLNTAESKKVLVAVNSYNADLIKIYRQQGLDLKPITETIQGTLYKPQGNGPFPAVVVFHGCGGARNNSFMWAKWYEERGFVSLVVDGFTPRGIRTTCTGLQSIKRSTRLNDAMGGADFLASLPFVDKSRIGITGFSNGAGRAMNIVEKRFQEKVGSAVPAFAFSIPLYPECREAFGFDSSGYRRGPFGTPMLILIGEDDDWTLAKSCRTVVDLTKDDEYPVDLKVYPNAHHAFDDGSGFHVMPDADNWNSPTGRGATVAGNPAATEQAKADVAAYLRKLGMME